LGWLAVRASFEIFKIILHNRDQVIDRMSFEESVKVKTSEDDEEEVLITDGKGNGSNVFSCKDSIEIIFVYPSSSKTLTKELSKVLWNTTVII